MGRFELEATVDAMRPVPERAKVIGPGSATGVRNLCAVSPPYLRFVARFGHGGPLGYARVSTTEQNPDLQVDELTAAGCWKV